MKIKKLFYGVLVTTASLFAVADIQTTSTVKASSSGYTTYGHPIKKGDEYKGMQEGLKDNKKSDKEWKKQSDKLSKTRDKNIEYNLDGSISKDKSNISVAKKYKKELPNLEKQLKSLKQGTKQYKALNQEIQLHKTAIKAIFG